MNPVPTLLRPAVSTAITLTGAKAHRWLQHSRHGRVAAVYKQCLYLANEQDELLCLGSRRLGPGPINALCDAHWGGTGYINAGEIWQRQGDVIHVGTRHRFRIDHPAVWRPAPAKGPWNSNTTGDRLHRVRVYLYNIDAGPLMPLLLMQDTPRRNRVEAAFEQQATSGIHALLQWLEDSLVHSRSPEEIPEGVVHLIGLGPGLTPSGDDFLGGALVALRTLQIDTPADRLANWIKRRAPALTSNISLAHLLAACDGEALEPVHRGLNAILENRVRENRVRDLFPMRRSEKPEKPSLTPFSPDEMETTLANLSALGHSSGWDAFSGVLAVVNIWQRELENLVRDLFPMRRSEKPEKPSLTRFS